MTNQKEQDTEHQPYHVRKWQDAQLSIMEKPHHISNKMEVYHLSKVFKIVKR